MKSQWALIEYAIPNDHSRQVSAYDMTRVEMGRADAPSLVVDLGCGDGASVATFREAKPDVKWIGLDLYDNDSTRAISEEAVVLYDGTSFPFGTGSVPLVYSRQVLEHVRYPEAVIAEVARILQPGGRFIGSTSHLEPFHAESLWNFTPYGFSVLVSAAGLELEEIRPGIDGVALTTRAYQGRKPEHGAWFKRDSPMNADIESWGRSTGRTAAQVNSRKLEYCGHFGFRVRKPLDWRRAELADDRRTMLSDSSNTRGSHVAETVRSSARRLERRLRSVVRPKATRRG